MRKNNVVKKCPPPLPMRKGLKIFALPPTPPAINNEHSHITTCAFFPPGYLPVTPPPFYHIIRWMKWMILHNQTYA